MNIKSPSPHGTLAKDRLADLMATADQLGLHQLSRKGDPVLKITVPGTVDLFDLYALRRRR